MKCVQPKSGATFLAIAALIGGLFTGINTLRRASAAEPAPAPPPAPGAAPFAAKLKNGVSVELLGMVRGMVVSESWLPDGTPLDQPAIAKARFERSKVIHAPEEHPRPGIGVVFRLNLKMRDGFLATCGSEQW